jgi:hypothetical protein
MEHSADPAVLCEREKGIEMRATMKNPEAGRPLSLEAEAAVWRSKRNGRPNTIAGKVPVVRIRRRVGLASWPASVERDIAVAPK